jgi:hypothetical protein
MQLELLRSERFAQVEFEGAALLRCLLHFEGEEPVIAPAAVLGCVERHVSLLQKLVGVDAIHRSHGNADRGPNVDAVAIDIEWILERPRQPLGKPLGVLVTFRADLQHNKLVAAEAGDHVSRPNDGLESRGDLFKELVANWMAKRVIDRLESIKVDQVNRDVVPPLVHGCEHAVNALAEVVAVRETRELVVLGEVGDALLRALAFGHVLENHDRPAAGHHPARHGDGAIAVRRGLNLVETVFPKPLGEVVEDLLHASRLVVAGTDAVPDQLRRRHVDADRRVIEMQHFEEPVVPHLQAVLFVKHAEAVRHVVERDIEAIGLLLEAGGERRFLARHRERLDDDIANAQRDVDHPVNEHQHDETQRLVGPIGISQQRDRHWQRAKCKLADGDEGPAGIAPGNCSRISG